MISSSLSSAKVISFPTGLCNVLIDILHILVHMQLQWSGHHWHQALSKTVWEFSVLLLLALFQAYCLPLRKWVWVGYSVEYFCSGRFSLSCLVVFSSASSAILNYLSVKSFSPVHRCSDLNCTGLLGVDSVTYSFLVQNQFDDVKSLKCPFYLNTICSSQINYE